MGVRTEVQPSLLGEPDDPTDRLLLALYPDREAALHIAELRSVLARTSALTGAPVGIERLHITLIHVGDYFGLPRAIAASAADAAAKVSLPAFDVTLDRAMSFSGRPGELPFVLLAEPSEPLMLFQQVLRFELEKAGVRHKSGKQFTPHVTLLRDRESIPAQPIAPIRWTAREFMLAHSLLRRAEHVPLGRWALSD